MQPPIQPYEYQRKIDGDHLKLLSVFHFVGAGLAIIGMLFLFGHYTLMSSLFDNPKMWDPTKPGSAPPPEFFAAFRWFYVAGGLFLLVSCAANVLSGIFLRQRKHRTFSFIVAGLNCLHMPLGTTLGVFTIIVLCRQSVKESYQ